MVKQMSRGQVSLEYLMTYGIAIAIVVIAVAALYSMGVFSPKSSAVACSPCFSNFAYIDYSNGTISISNGVRNINITGLQGGTLSNGCAINGICPANQKMNINGISPTGTTQLNITYKDLYSGLEHTDTATVHN